jgi:hypothetical protein
MSDSGSPRSIGSPVSPSDPAISAGKRRAVDSDMDDEDGKEDSLPIADPMEVAEEYERNEASTKRLKTNHRRQDDVASVLPKGYDCTITVSFFMFPHAFCVCFVFLFWP